MSQLVKLTVSSLITQEERYLLVQSSKENLWSLPAGKVEYGELPQIAMLRECKEEIGARVKLTEIIGIYSFQSRRGNWITDINFYGELKEEPRIVRPEEIFAIDWFSLEEIEDLKKEKKLKNPKAQLSPIRDYESSKGKAYSLDILKRAR